MTHEFIFNNKTTKKIETFETICEGLEDVHERHYGFSKADQFTDQIVKQLFDPIGSVATIRILNEDNEPIEEIEITLILDNEKELTNV